MDKIIQTNWENNPFTSLSNLELDLGLQPSNTNQLGYSQISWVEEGVGLIIKHQYLTSIEEGQPVGSWAFTIFQQ